MTLDLIPVRFDTIALIDGVFAIGFLFGLWLGRYLP